MLFVELNAKKGLYDLLTLYCRELIKILIERYFWTFFIYFWMRKKKTEIFFIEVFFLFFMLISLFRYSYNSLMKSITFYNYSQTETVSFFYLYNLFKQEVGKNIEKRLNSLKENFFVKKSILYKMVYFFATLIFFLVVIT